MEHLRGGVVEEGPPRAARVAAEISPRTRKAWTKCEVAGELKSSPKSGRRNLRPEKIESMRTLSAAWEAAFYREGDGRCESVTVADCPGGPHTAGGIDAHASYDHTEGKFVRLGMCVPITNKGQTLKQKTNQLGCKRCGGCWLVQNSREAKPEEEDCCHMAAAWRQQGRPKQGGR